jgi:hypothetical protein
LNLKLKLGRKYPTRAKLKLANYLGPKLPPPPVSVDWTLAVIGNLGMMLNDSLGDCTCAAMGHITQVVTANSDGEITPSDNDVLKMYEVIGGYVPGNRSTDNGATEVDAMKYMVTTGLCGVKLDAFADVAVSNLEQVKQTIALLGCAYIGVQLPQSAMDAFQAGQPWTDTSDPHILGGHAIPLFAYDADGATCATWGKLQKMSWAWFSSYCDEAHACLMFPWVKNSADCSPDGFDLPTLEADLKSL